MPTVYEEAAQFNKELDADGNSAMRRVLPAYRAVKHNLEPKVEQLAAEGSTDPGRMWRLDRGQSLLRQIDSEIGRFSNVVESNGAPTIRQAGNRAMDHSAKLIGDFNRLPKEALNQLVGVLETPAMGRALDQYGPLARRSIGNGLIQGVGQGLNPKAATRLAMQGLDRSLLPRVGAMVHTQQMEAYREAARQGYIKNGIKVWVWWSALTERTCPVCIAMHGTEHPVENKMGTHPRCRCTMIPKVPKTPPARKGPDLFRTMPRRVQESILGPAAMRAYDEGLIGLDDLVQYGESADWGPYRSQRSLASLGIDRRGFPLEEDQPFSIYERFKTQDEEKVRQELNDQAVFWNNVNIFTHDELTELEDYTAFGSSDLNKRLRRGRPYLVGDPDLNEIGDPDLLNDEDDPDYVKGVLHEMDEAMRVRWEAIDRIFHRGEVASDFVVQRGIPVQVDKDDRLLQVRPGDVVVDPAFLSTTLRSSVAESFGLVGGYSKQFKPIIVNIHVPDDARALYLESISTEPQEREVLLPRSSKLQVIEVVDRYHPRQDVTVRHMDVEWAPPEWNVEQYFNANWKPWSEDWPDIDDLFQDEYDPALLNDEERMAAKAYTHLAYGPMNRLLRRGSYTEINPNVPVFPEGEVQVRRFIDYLKSGLRVVRVPIDLRVFRGINKPTTLGEKLQVGQRLEDKGFVSTSISDRQAEMFASGQDLVVIEVPKGTHGLYLPNDAVSTHPNEREFILPPDSGFIIKEVREWDSWDPDWGAQQRRVIVAELDPNEQFFFRPPDDNEDLSEELDDLTTRILRRVIPDFILPDKVRESLTFQVTDWLQPVTTRIGDTLFEAALRYVMASGELNQWLREGRLTPNPDLAWQADKLNRAINYVQIPNDLMTYRGLRGEIIDDILELKKGDLFIDRGLVSTSLDPATAAGFAGQHMDRTGLLIKIRMPGGKLGAMTAPMIYEPSIDGELELLLPSGTNFRVVSDFHTSEFDEHLSDYSGMRQDVMVLEVEVEDQPFIGRDVSQALTPDNQPRWTRGQDVPIGELEQEFRDLRPDHVKNAISLYNSRDRLWRDSFTMDARDAMGAAIDKYKASSEAVNNWLRELSEPEDTDEAGDVIEQLDEAIHMTRNEKPMLLYRGMSRNFVKHFGAIDTGDIIVDPGFLSTSVDPVIGEQFTNQGKAPLAEIILPAGAKGLYVDDLGENLMEEAEVILPRDTQLRVVEWLELPEYLDEYKSPNGVIIDRGHVVLRLELVDDYQYFEAAARFPDTENPSETADYLLEEQKFIGRTRDEDYDPDKIMGELYEADELDRPQNEHLRKAVHIYTSVRGLVMNRLLRNQFDPASIEDMAKTLGINVEVAVAGSQAVINDLDAAFRLNRSPLGYAIERGMQVAEDSDLLNLRPGDSFIDPAFLSAAPQPEVAEMYAIEALPSVTDPRIISGEMEPVGIIWELRVPDGYGSILADPYTINQGLNEIILPRGTPWVIEEVTDEDLTFNDWIEGYPIRRILARVNDEQSFDLSNLGFKPSVVEIPRIVNNRLRGRDLIRRGHERIDRVDPDVLGEGDYLGGSTGAFLIYDPITGVPYVRKEGNSPEHVREESLADTIYEITGIKVPSQRLLNNEVKLAEFIEGTVIADYFDQQAAQAKVRQGFAVDALLGNWDVVGLVGDNVMVDPSGNAYRIDNGGSLRFRAQGARKTNRQWNTDVVEIDTLRENSNWSGRVFGSLTDREVADQIQTLIVPNREAILEAVDDATLKKTMAGRIDYMEKWAAKQGAPPVDIEAMVEELDRAFDPSPDEITVRRGARVHIGHSLLDLRPGDLFRDPGFLEATTETVTPEAGMVFELTIPRGRGVVRTGDADLILPRNVRWQVDGVEDVGTVRRIAATALDREQFFFIDEDERVESLGDWMDQDPEGSEEYGEGVAIRDYTTKLGFLVNKYLRSDRDPEPVRQLSEDLFRGNPDWYRIHQTIRGMNSVFNRFRAPVDWVTHRGILVPEDSEILELKPGDQIADKAFLSTSLDPAVAQRFIEGDSALDRYRSTEYLSKVIFELHGPEGTPAIHADPYSYDPDSGMMEVVLPRQLPFTVDWIEYHGDTMHVIATAAEDVIDFKPVVHDEDLMDDLQMFYAGPIIDAEIRDVEGDLPRPEPVPDLGIVEGEGIGPFRDFGYYLPPPNMDDYPENPWEPLQLEETTDTFEADYWVSDAYDVPNINVLPPGRYRRGSLVRRPDRPYVTRRQSARFKRLQKRAVEANRRAKRRGRFTLQELQDLQRYNREILALPSGVITKQQRKTTREAIRNLNKAIGQANRQYRAKIRREFTMPLRAARFARHPGLAIQRSLRRRFYYTLHPVRALRRNVRRALERRRIGRRVWWTAKFGFKVVRFGYRLSRGILRRLYRLQKGMRLRAKQRQILNLDPGTDLQDLPNVPDVYIGIHLPPGFPFEELPSGKSIMIPEDTEFIVISTRRRRIRGKRVILLEVQALFPDEDLALLEPDEQLFTDSNFYDKSDAEVMQTVRELDAYYENWVQNRPDEEEVDRVIADYTQGEAILLNNWLRRPRELYPKVERDMVQLRDTLDRALAESRIPRDMEVARAISFRDPIVEEVPYREAEPGDIIIDPGYMSTTLNPKFPETWSRDAELIIQLKEGDSALWLGSATRYFAENRDRTLEEVPYENQLELLLPRGLPLEVIDREMFDVEVMDINLPSWADIVVRQVPRLLVRVVPERVRKLWSVQNFEGPFHDADEQIEQSLKEETRNANFTERQRELLEDYTNYGAEVNRILRGGDARFHIDNFDEVVENMEDLLATSSVPTGLVVWRGIHDARDYDIYNLEPGDIFTDDAFISTSIDPEVAANFIDQDGMEFRIEVPEGVEGLYVAELSRVPHEKELILPRGWAMEVQFVEDDEIEVINDFGDIEETNIVRRVWARMRPWRNQYFEAPYEYPDVRLEEELESAAMAALDETGNPERIKSTIAGYSNTGYRPVNDVLRGNQMDVTGYYRAMIANLDEAMEHAEIPIDVEVFRGIGSIPADHPIMHLREGDIFTDKAYQSTSLDSFTAEMFGNVRFHIEVPEGKKGLYIAEFSDLEHEKELLLPRGTRLEVFNVEDEEDEYQGSGFFDNSGKWVTTALRRIYARMVGNEQYFLDDPNIPDFGDKAVEKYLREIQYKAWRNAQKIQKKHRDAVRGYTGADAGPINRSLRFGEDRPLSSTDEYTREEAIERLDQVINTDYTSRPIVVRRGLSIGNLGTNDFMDLDVGDVFVDPGFSSTTIDKDTGDKFSYPGLLMEIMVPKGHNVAYIQPESVHPQEKELLLPRGTSFEIVDVDPAYANTWTSPVGGQVKFIRRLIARVLPRDQRMQMMTLPEYAFVIQQEPDVVDLEATAWELRRLIQKGIEFRGNQRPVDIPVHVLQDLNRSLDSLVDIGESVEGLRVRFANLGPGRDNVYASFSPLRQTITINMDSPYWKDKLYGQQEARTAWNEGWTAGFDRNHVITHELAHYVHNKKITKAVLESRTKEFTPHERRIARKVSRYGATRPDEFVAEVFVGLINGTVYSEDVMRLYRRYDGPEV